MPPKKWGHFGGQRFLIEHIPPPKSTTLCVVGLMDFGKHLAILDFGFWILDSERFRSWPLPPLATRSYVAES